MRRRFEAELREMLPEAFQDQIADTVVAQAYSLLLVLRLTRSSNAMP